LQADVRKLEAEVGPIKYIAEMVYGESADKDILEKAVRWVIITIIFVFDPLAVLLLIASQYTLEFIKTTTSNKSTVVEEQIVNTEVMQELNEKTEVASNEEINRKIDKIVEEKKSNEEWVNKNTI